MQTLFYLLLLPIIIGSLMKMFSPIKYQIYTDNLKCKKSKDLDGLDILVFLFNLYSLVICFVGLLSSQWIVFSVVLFTAVILAQIKIPVVTHFIVSLVTVTGLLFAIINKFHLHINLMEYLF